MTDKTDWLSMLESATNYCDLQNALSLLTFESTATTNRDALVEKIDEAIRRIEQERARDETELDKFSAEYDQFKQQQAGLVGWFKRKLPFTETRKQELEHRDTVNDQAAEILADNIFIARVQMLKERIASPKSRRMGNLPIHWRDQFSRFDSVLTIREYGSVIHDLGRELAAARQFKDLVSVDVDAFARAKFSNKEDQARKHADLQAAKTELEALNDELNEKTNLRLAALVTIKELLVQDLSTKDIDFRNRNSRLATLKNLVELQPKLLELLQERLDGLTAVSEKIRELDAIPETRITLEKSLGSLERDLKQAEDRVLAASNGLKEPSQIYSNALSESQSADAALKATKPLYEAYLAEQRNVSQSVPEVSSDFDFKIPDSSVLAEYQRLESAAAAAAETLRKAEPAFARVKQVHDDVVREASIIREKIDGANWKLREINEADTELREQIVFALQNLDTCSPVLNSALNNYLEKCHDLPGNEIPGGANRSLQAIQSGLMQSAISQPRTAFDRSYSSNLSSQSRGDVRENIEHLENSVRLLKADQASFQREISTLSQTQKDILLRRAQMLLDQAVCMELQ